MYINRICLIHHLKGLEKSDDLGEVTNYANRWMKTLMLKLVYFIIVTRIHSAFICGKIQVYDVMVEYNNWFLYLDSSI